MEKFASILFVLMVACLQVSGQDSTQHTLIFKGQLATWANLNPGNDLPVWTGVRYLPQLNYNIEMPQTRKIDFEVSGNLFGVAGFHPFDSAYTDGDIKPYRAWARYSSKQFEFRVGLQKINFGSAAILRPLMWFDQLDPRDPLQFTDGVWGALGRYYFLNNANIWVWGLYGNKNPRGWEAIPSNWKKPEFGGRVQLPVPRGEMGLTYHHRIADSRDINSGIPESADIPENRIGLDAKLDWVLGAWIEASWIRAGEDLSIFTNQEVFNLGVDYTFGVGNGLYVIFEQLLFSLDQDPFAFSNTTTFSILSMSYPIGFFDNLSAIVYFDWTNKNVYNFINWQRQFDKTTLFVMGYWNPKDTQLPTQNSTQNLYSGVGLQVLFVFNH